MYLYFIYIIICNLLILSNWNRIFKINSYFYFISGIRCVAHTLQLAVIDSLKGSTVEKLLNKVRVLVKKLRNQTYLYLIKKEKLKSPVLDCLTRWHSTLDMLERVQYLKPFILNMSANDSKLNKLSMSNFEWQQVDALCKALLPAKICTKKLQSEQLTLTDFYGAWLTCKIQTQSLNTNFSNNLSQCLIIREQHIMNNKVLLSAIYLDPRFKNMLTQEQSTIAIEHLINVWVHIKELEKKEIEFVGSMKNPTIEDNDNGLASMNDSDELETFLQEKDNESSLSFNSPTQGSTATRIEAALKSYYLDQKRLSHKLNVLKFWKQMETTYPELAELAKTIYSVPSTQVSVERLFSGLKFILSPYRTSVSSKNLEDQLLVRTNRLFENKNTQNK